MSVNKVSFFLSFYQIASFAAPCVSRTRGGFASLHFAKNPKKNLKLYFLPLP
jgi:hypothetical protein